VRDRGHQRELDKETRVPGVLGTVQDAQQRSSDQERASYREHTNQCCKQQQTAMQ
jgi:hypothetical protein